MSYLSCPKCGLTLFDRNPLTSPRHCPRCRRKDGAGVELERVAKPGRAAASILKPRPDDGSVEATGAA